MYFNDQQSDVPDSTVDAIELAVDLHVQGNLNLTLTLTLTLTQTLENSRKAVRNPKPAEKASPTMRNQLWGVK